MKSFCYHNLNNVSLQAIKQLVIDFFIYKIKLKSWKKKPNHRMNCLVLTLCLALAAHFHFSSETGRPSSNILTTQPGEGLFSQVGKKKRD